MCVVFIESECAAFGFCVISSNKVGGSGGWRVKKKGNRGRRQVNDEKGIVKRKNKKKFIFITDSRRVCARSRSSLLVPVDRDARSLARLLLFFRFCYVFLARYFMCFPPFYNVLFCLCLGLFCVFPVSFLYIDFYIFLNIPIYLLLLRLLLLLLLQLFLSFFHA